MSTSLRSAPPDSGPRRGLPRWAWVLIGLLAVIAIVAAAIAVFTARGKQVIVLPPSPTPAVASAGPTPSSSPSASISDATLADGCLGGATELDRAVLTAQRDAPLTPAGAASFTATLVRWATATPPPPYQAQTARQVLAGDATPAATRFPSGSHALPGAVGSIDFADGRYYVEAFDGRSAIVSYVGTGTATQDGVPQGSGYLAGATHLVAQNGTWHLADISAERDLTDLLRVGSPYAGGC